MQAPGLLRLHSLTVFEAALRDVDTRELQQLLGTLSAPAAGPLRLHKPQLQRRLLAAELARRRMAGAAVFVSTMLGGAMCLLCWF